MCMSARVKQAAMTKRTIQSVIPSLKNLVQSAGILKSNIIILFATFVLILVPRSGFVQDLSKDIGPFGISGHVESNEGENIRYGKIRIRVNGEYFGDANVNSSGNYSISGIPAGSFVEAFPYYSDSRDVRSSPEDREISSILADVVQNFTVTPGIVVSNIRMGNLYYSVVGTQVWVYGHHVGDFSSPYQADVLFYPGDYGLPNAEYIEFRRPFTNYSPQSEGSFDRYDGRFSMISSDNNPVGIEQTITTYPDTPVQYSWDTPGGLGWSLFPSTPDDRLPNNPYVVVEARFPYLGGSWPADRIWLNGVHSETELTAANGYLARFRWPIADCSRGVLHVSVEFQKGATRVLWPLAGGHGSGTSDADLTGDGYLNLSDISAFVPLLGSCEGSPSFEPCADYSADGCISLPDATILDIILYYGGDKTGVGANMGSNTVALGAIDERTWDITMNAADSWDVARIRLFAEGEDGNMVFQSAPEFEDRAVMIPFAVPNGYLYDILVLERTPLGLTHIGSVAVGDVGVSAKPEVRAVEIAPADWLGTDKGRRGATSDLRDGFTCAAPNPCNPNTLIRYSTFASDPYSMSIYDVAGRLVKRLFSQQVLEHGEHAIEWDGRCDTGESVSAGVYLCRLESLGASEVLRITVLK